MENKAIWVGSPSGGDCIQVGSVEAHFEVDDEMDQVVDMEVLVALLLLFIHSQLFVIDFDASGFVLSKLWRTW